MKSVFIVTQEIIVSTENEFPPSINLYNHV